jgi:type IX secretion system PorP/SprF family membrane protein
MKGLVILLFALIAFCSNAQDVHFSQFWNNGIQFNPGMAGVIPANLRAAVFYRDQWSGIGTKFNTYGANVDVRVDGKGNASFGFGANVYRDVAGDHKLGNTGAQLAFSTILALDRQRKFSVGVSGGIIQKGLDVSGAQWNSQYSGGSYNQYALSGESFNSVSEIKGDLSAGIVYYFSTNERYMTSNDAFNMKIGVAYNHILRPKFDWFASTPDALYRNLVAHAEFLIGIQNSKWSILPAVIAQFQGPSKEILFGSRYRYKLKNASRVTGYVKGAFLNLGTFYRLGDSFIPSCSIEFNGYSIGFSYDFNVSKLRAISGGGSGFEISFKFKSTNPYLWQGHGRGTKKW